MLKKCIKPLALLVTLLMAISVFAACGQSNNTSGGTEKTTAQEEKSTTQTELAKSPYEIQKEKFQEIVMYLPGAAPTDFEKVMEKINEKLKTSVNANLKINYVSWGDLETKFPLLLASGENFDMIFSGTWCFFVDGIKKGAYMPLQKLLPDYAPGLWKDLPKEYWDSSTYNGDILSIPKFDDGINTYGLFYRDDLRVKYGLPEIKTMEDMENFLKAVKAKETEIKPFVGGQFDVGILGWAKEYFTNVKYTTLDSVQYLLGYVESSPDKLYSTLDPNPVDNEAGKKGRELIKRWNDEGLISKNMSSNKTRGVEYVRNGTSAVAGLNISNAVDEYVNIRNAHPDWDFKYFIFDLNQDIIIKAPANSNAVSVYKNSANPEKAVMVFDQLAGDLETNRLARYGIKGVHYDIDADGKRFVPEGTDPSLFGDGSMSSWAWSQYRYMLPIRGSSDWMKNLQENIVGPKLKSAVSEHFVPVLTEINAEIAACTQIYNTYSEGFNSGILDPVKDYDTLAAKLKAAGLEKIQQVIQAQWTEYLKTLKK